MNSETTALQTAYYGDPTSAPALQENVREDRFYTLYQHIHFPSGPFVSRWGRTLEHIYLHHRATAQYSIKLLLEIGVVAGRILQGVPKVVSDSARTALLFGDLFAIPEMLIKLCGKTRKDMRDAWQERDRIGTLAMACTTVKESLDLCFAVGNFVVAVATLAGYTQLSTPWRRQIRPLRILAATAAVAASVYNSFLKQSVHQCLSQLPKQDDKDRILRIVKKEERVSPMTLKTTTIEYCIGAYRYNMQYWLDRTIYHIPCFNRLGQAIDRHCQARRRSLKDTGFPLPSRGQMKRVMKEVNWKHLQWTLSPDAKREGVFESLRAHYGRGESIPGASFVLICTKYWLDYWSKLLANVYPDASVVMDLLLSTCETLEFWLDSHYTERGGAGFRRLRLKEHQVQEVQL